ncbi:MAG: hypothetical protein IT462_07140 [Planctomycetes bacterium]|nr:hypothetical protein [Planctomycetota bacterium]
MPEAPPPAKASKPRLRWWKFPVAMIAAAAMLLVGFEVVRQIMIATACAELRATRERLDKAVLHGKSLQQFYESRVTGRNGWAAWLAFQDQIHELVQRPSEFNSDGSLTRPDYFEIGLAIEGQDMNNAPLPPPTQPELKFFVDATAAWLPAIEALTAYDSIIVCPIPGGESASPAFAVLPRLHLWSHMCLRIEAQRRLGDKNGVAHDVTMMARLDALFRTPVGIYDAYFQLRCRELLWDKIGKLAAKNELDQPTLDALLRTAAPSTTILTEALECGAVSAFFYWDRAKVMEGDPLFDWLYRKNDVVDWYVDDDNKQFVHPFTSWQFRRNEGAKENYLLNCLDTARARGTGIASVDFDLPASSAPLDGTASQFWGETVRDQFRILRLKLEQIRLCRAAAHLRLAEFAQDPLRAEHPAFATAAPVDSWVEMKFVDGKCVLTLSYDKFVKYAGPGHGESEAAFRADNLGLLLEPRK